MADAWFRKPATGAPTRLFCLPYAGGNAAVFASWQAMLAPDIEVMPARLPGRLERIKEPARCSLPGLARELADAMIPYLDRPFAVFGVSMGALLAFETLRLLEAAGYEAVRLIPASYPAPSLPSCRPAMHATSDEEFIETLRMIGAAPPGFFDAPGLMNLVLPTVRADFAVTETYGYRDSPVLRTPITAIYGTGDHIASREDFSGWSRETSAGFDLHEMSGGHFMVHSQAGQLCLAHP